MCVCVCVFQVCMLCPDDSHCCLGRVAPEIIAGKAVSAVLIPCLDLPPNTKPGSFAIFYKLSNTLNLGFVPRLLGLGGVGLTLDLERRPHQPPLSVFRKTRLPKKRVPTLQEGPVDCPLCFVHTKSLSCSVAPMILPFFCGY